MLQDATINKFAEAISAMDPESAAALFARLGGDPAALADAEPASVAASGSVAQLARRVRRPIASPEAPSSTATGLLAAGGATGITPGEAITDRLQLARVMSDTLQGMSKDGPRQGKVVLASARWSYPEERKLMAEDGLGNSERILTVCGPNAAKYDRSGALVATGGICQPVNIDYAVPTWATPERSIRDGLPPFEATRGGIRFVQPPDIAEWEAATGIWTEATDASPGTETKPVKVLACGTEESVYVEAVSTRIGFGNMQSRFAPEQVAANTDIAFAAAARVAEENLLNLIEEKCVKKLETAQHLGLGRDLLSAVDYARAAYKNIHRVSPTQAFTAIMPDWVKDLIRADIAREQAHDNASTFNVWEVSDEQINDIFARRHVNVIWHLDAQKEPSSKNYKTQYWGAPAEGKKLDELLPKIAGGAKELMAWYFFPEGAIQYLDAGRLDLGVVRDSTLDATNDYECFTEVFESVANRGVANGVWQILSGLSVTGGSSATVTAVAP